MIFEFWSFMSYIFFEKFSENFVKFFQLFQNWKSSAPKTRKSSMWCGRNAQNPHKSTFYSIFINRFLQNFDKMLKISRVASMKIFSSFSTNLLLVFLFYLIFLNIFKYYRRFSLFFYFFRRRSLNSFFFDFSSENVF